MTDKLHQGSGRRRVKRGARQPGVEWLQFAGLVGGPDAKSHGLRGARCSFLNPESSCRLSYIPVVIAAVCIACFMTGTEQAPYCKTLASTKQKKQATKVDISSLY